jgi:SAM-dependent methyltransferase
VPGEDVYEDPRLASLYDFLNPWTDQDDFYLARARELGGPVLDLGCGTGRLAVRIAEERIEVVVGAEPAAGMIGVARSRPGGERVEWVQTTGQALDLGRRFKLIYMTGHAFQAVPTDEEATALLLKAAAHLEPEGGFIFETRNPLDRAWERWSGPRTEVTSEYGRMYEDYEIDASEAPDRISITHHIHLVDRGEELVGHSRLRFPSRGLLEAQLVEAGLELIEWYGDWDGSPLREHSVEMIAVTTKRA